MTTPAQTMGATLSASAYPRLTPLENVGLAQPSLIPQDRSLIVPEHCQIIGFYSYSVLGDITLDGDLIIL